MIYHSVCDRRQFAEFIVGRAVIPSSEVKQIDAIHDVAFGRGDINVAWASDPSKEFSLPRCVIVSDGEVGDFLAWASTYFRHIRPFTAHCRVLSRTLAMQVNELRGASWNQDLRSADVGLVIAEAIAYSVGHSDLSRLTLPFFSRTLSYSFARSLRLSRSIESTRDSFSVDIREAWSCMRDLVGEASLHLSSWEISNVWDCIISSAKSDGINRSRESSELNCAVNDIFTHGHILRNNWSALARPLRDPAATWNVMEGPREGRVIAVESAIHELAKGTSSDRMNRAALAGYLASRVNPGTLDHFQLLFPLVNDLPEALLWYGACAGLSHETTIENYANGVGWIMKRELGRAPHWIERPTCDIALSELEVLLRDREHPFIDFPTKVSGALDVEILPFVASSVRWSSDHRSSKSRLPSQQALFAKEAGIALEVRELLRKIEESSMSLEAIRQQVERTFGDEGPRKSQGKVTGQKNKKRKTS